MNSFSENANKQRHTTNIQMYEETQQDCDLKHYLDARLPGHIKLRSFTKRKRVVYGPSAKIALNFEA